jgi:penicillin-binding protein 2
MVRSIVLSSNVYYYALATDMGVDAIHDFMKPLGFGQITGIDINGEVRGVLPSQEWKRNAYRRPEQKKWYPGETISLGIGQGYNTFTMLQLAQATAVLANNGVKHKPRLVIATQDTVTGVMNPLPVDPPVDLGYKPAHVEIIRKALVGVTQEGTSTRVFAGAGYLSGGKTGTAQAVTIGQKDKYNGAKLEEHQRDHALYMAFAPADKPEIALAVIVENAGWGAGVAAPIARRVFDYVLMGQYPSAEDMVAVQKGLAAAPVGTPRRVADMNALLVAGGTSAAPAAAAAAASSAKAANPGTAKATAKVVSPSTPPLPPPGGNPD